MPAFMKLGDIKGEATDADHKDWIIIESMSSPIFRSIPEGAKDQQRTKGETTLEVAELEARPGDILSVWIEARDGDVVRGPNRGRSDARRLTISSDTLRSTLKVTQLSEAVERGG